MSMNALNYLVDLDIKTYYFIISIDILYIYCIDVFIFIYRVCIVSHVGTNLRRQGMYMHHRDTNITQHLLHIFNLCFIKK